MDPKPYGSAFPIDCLSKNRVDIDHWTLDGERITDSTTGVIPNTIASPELGIEFMTLLLEGQYKCFGAGNFTDPLDTINVFVIGKRYSIL